MSRCLLLFPYNGGTARLAMGDCKMMKLAQLFSSITDASLEIPGNPEKPAELPDLVDADVSAVTADSRKVKPGTVFVALEGGKSDGHQFLLEAAKAGAS